MTWHGEMPATRLLDEKYSQILEDFIFVSNIINEIQGTTGSPTIIKKGFVMDWESVPFFRGTCHVAGLIHDACCRKNFVPKLAKKQAADVYFEFLEYRKAPSWRKYIKYWAVRLVPATVYFHTKTLEWEI